MAQGTELLLTVQISTKWILNNSSDLALLTFSRGEKIVFRKTC